MNNKILLVTGATSDIGMELLSKIGDRYEKIYAHFVKSKDRIEKLSNMFGDRLVPIAADFNKKGELEVLVTRLLEAEIPNHIVHLSQARSENKKFHKFSISDYEEAMRTGVYSIVYILNKLLPLIGKKGYGRVVFMLSSFVEGVSPRYQSPYIVSKYALYGLMKNLSAEYVDKGIRVNAISPDMIETRFIEDIPRLIIEQNAMKSPLGRNLNKSDIIPHIEYLLSESAETIYGQNIKIMGER